MTAASTLKSDGRGARVAQVEKMSKSKLNVVNPDDVIGDTAPTPCGCTSFSWARSRSRSRGR